MLEVPSLPRKTSSKPRRRLMHSSQSADRKRAASVESSSRPRVPGFYRALNTLVSIVESYYYWVERQIRNSLYTSHSKSNKEGNCRHQTLTLVWCCSLLSHCESFCMTYSWPLCADTMTPTKPKYRYIKQIYCFQCFDTVSWVTGRASILGNTCMTSGSHY